MRREQTSVDGAYVLGRDRHSDQRGSFERLWCAQESSALGLCAAPVQISLSDNPRLGTLRGLHFQVAPHGEQKTVTCVSGRIFDVIADVRRTSKTYGRWFGLELTPACGNSLYIPEGVAHGFLTLEDDSRVLYQISSPYVASAARTIRYDDADLGIEWPLVPSLVSESDRLGLSFAEGGDYSPPQK